MRCNLQDFLMNLKKCLHFLFLVDKRRVALAGILAMEPEYLILDEPVAGMDAPGKKILFDLYII